MQLPSNLLITRLPPSIYLSCAATVWGVVSTCNGAVQSFGQLVAVRLILGFVECPFFPGETFVDVGHECVRCKNIILIKLYLGAIFLMSSWYTRSELTKRISWFYSGNALANMFGGLLVSLSEKSSSTHKANKQNRPPASSRISTATWASPAGAGSSLSKASSLSASPSPRVSSYPTIQQRPNG